MIKGESGIGAEQPLVPVVFVERLEWERQGDESEYEGYEAVAIFYWNLIKNTIQGKYIEI